MILSIFEHTLLLLPLLIGAYLSISMMKLPDLSIESAYVFGATLAISLQEVASFPMMALVSMLGGIVVGIVVGCLNQFFRLPFLLAAIITNGLFHGGVQYVLGTSMMTFHVASMNLYGLVVIAFILIGVMGYIFRSQLGLAFAIFGNNPLFFSHHQSSSRYVVMMGLCLADACAGLSGFLFAYSNGFVDLTMGYGIVLLCLTALILGKMLIPTQRPFVFIPVVGMFAYMLIQQLLLNMGLDLKYFNAFQALFVLGALIILMRQQGSHFSQLVDHLGV